MRNFFLVCFLLSLTTLAPANSCLINCGTNNSTNNSSCITPQNSYWVTKYQAKYDPLRYPIRTLFLPRSQGSNTARRLAGWQHVLPSCDHRVDGDINIVVQYAHSFDPERIASYLFGSNCLELVGTKQANLIKDTGLKEYLKTVKLRADDLGLPSDFIGKICFKPQIDSTVVDVLFHILLDPWCNKMFAKAFVPITYTSWDLGMTNQTSNIPYNCTTGFRPCYMSIGPAAATTSICQALSGSFTFGDMRQPLNFGQFYQCKRRKLAVADIDLFLGVNIILRPDANVGPFLMVTVPTGNKPDGRHFFEPIVGNGGHWEFGGGVEGHYDLFRRDYKVFSICWFGHITYQFKAWQIRFYDLKNQGPFSRYFLLKELNKDGEYTGKLYNAIDFDSVATRAGGGVRTDASVKFSFYDGCWGYDLGYNLWALTEEELCINPRLYPADLRPCQKLLIKGSQGVCETAVNKALLVTKKDIDLTSGRIPTQLTNSIFAHISYTALNRVWEPQIGLGAQAEWATNSSDKCCPNPGLNQWRVWLKFGVSF